MVFSIFAAACVIVCWKTGRWRDWKQYYPTIMYFYMGSIVYGYLFYRKPLWAYSLLFHTYPFLELILTAFLYPATAILFLSFFPAKKKFQLVYVLLCSAVYTAIEAIAFYLGDFIYFNSWNIVYSALFNLAMFPLLLLHHKKPLLVWPISTALAFLLVWLFKVPLAR